MGSVACDACRSGTDCRKPRGCRGRAIAILLMSAVPARAMSTKSVLAELAGAGAGGTAHREVGLAALRADRRSAAAASPESADGAPDRPRRRGYRDRRRDLGGLLGITSDSVSTMRAASSELSGGGIEAWRNDFAGHAGEDLLIQRAGDFLLAPLRRHLGLLELVLAVTGGASGLAHFVADHGDDGVIRDSALARTVVVDYVAETRLALLHQAP